MTAITKLNLSGSTNGKNIKIAATSSPGTTVHTAHASNLDEVWLYLANTTTAIVQVTIECGGTTAPDDDIILSIPPKDGIYCVIPGFVYTGSVVVKVFAATTNVINATGYVNRIS